MREIKLWAKLKNEFIVQLKSAWIETEFAQNDGKTGSPLNDLRILHIQMELCDITLKDAIKRISSELNQSRKNGMTQVGAFLATKLFSEIVEGINYLHKQKIAPIMHRDLKPVNILLSLNQVGPNFIKISDFGCSKEIKSEFTTDENFNLIEYHTKAGTKRYMAPEIISGDKYDMCADIYSLGIILCDMFHIDESRLSDYYKYYLGIPNQFDYTPIIRLLEKLLHEWISMRPKCEDILRDRHMWEVDFDHIRMNDQIEAICHNNWYSQFYNKKDSLKLSTIIFMKKIQFEVKRKYELAATQVNDISLFKEYSSIINSMKTDVVGINSNMMDCFKENMSHLLPIILRAMSVCYSFEQVKSFLEIKLEERLSSHWHCYVSTRPIPNFPKIINWHNCKYFFFFFYNSSLKELVIQILLVNTVNIKVESNTPDIYKPVKSTMTPGMEEKSIAISVDEIEKNSSLEDTQNGICSRMKQLYKEYDWHCSISINELFLAYNDRQYFKYVIKYMAAFRYKKFCVIITSSKFLRSTPQSLQIKHKKNWHNISGEDQIIIESTITPNIGFFQSIHIRKVKLAPDKNFFVTIMHDMKEFIPALTKNPQNRYSFRMIDVEIRNFTGWAEFEWSYQKFLDRDMKLKKNTNYNSVQQNADVKEKLFKNIEMINISAEEKLILTAIESAKKLSEYNEHERLIATGIISFLLKILKNNFFTVCENAILKTNNEMRYQSLYALFEFARNATTKYKHELVQANCIQILIDQLKNSRDDNICFYCIRTLLVLLGCCGNCRDSVVEKDYISILSGLIKPNKSLSFLMSSLKEFQIIY